MGNPCKAIHIDAFNQTISEVEHNGDYRNIYTFLSAPLMPVDTFDAVRLDDGDAIYIDDEGLLKEPDADGFPNHWFKWEGYEQPLCGNGLILGSDEEGETVSPKITLEEARERVTFLKRSHGVLHGAHEAYRVPEPGFVFIER